MKTDIFAQNLANIGVATWIVVLAFIVPTTAIIITLIVVPPSLITSLDTYFGIKIIKL